MCISPALLRRVVSLVQLNIVERAVVYQALCMSGFGDIWTRKHTALIASTHNLGLVRLYIMHAWYIYIRNQCMNTVRIASCWFVIELVLQTNPGQAFLASSYRACGQQGPHILLFLAHTLVRVCWEPHATLTKKCVRQQGRPCLQDMNNNIVSSTQASAAGVRRCVQWGERNCSKSDHRHICCMCDLPSIYKLRAYVC